MEETLRKNKVSFLNTEDQKESVIWVQLLGSLFSCYCIDGPCICSVSALFPFPNNGKVFPCPQIWLGMKSMKVFRLTWHNVWRSQLPTFCKLKCPPSPAPLGVAADVYVLTSAHPAKVDSTNTKNELCVWMEGTVFTSFQGWLMTWFVPAITCQL